MSPRLPLRIDRAVAVNPLEVEEVADVTAPEERRGAVPEGLPPINVRRPSGAEPYGQARVDSNGTLQSKRNSDEAEFPGIEPVAAGMRRICDGDEAPLHIPIISAAPSQIVKLFRRQNPEREDLVRKNVARYPDVIRHEARRPETGHDRSAFESSYSQVMKREEEVTKLVGPQVTQDRRAASYAVSADRWPALIEAAPGDYLDNLMSVLRELRHNRRLAREQAGDLWNE